MKNMKTTIISLILITCLCSSVSAESGYGISNVFTIDNAETYLAFSSISNQTVGSSFNVTISARTGAGQVLTSYNQTAQLYVSGGPRLNRTSVYLQNGAWSGSLSLDSVSSSVYLSAVSGSFSGNSNTFSVTSAQGAYGRVDGSCVDSTGSPITGISFTVQLLRDGSVFRSTVSSQSSGRYSFNYVTPGVYTIRADGALGRSTSFMNHTVIAGATTTRDIPVYQAGQPVILVPGIMGSSTGGETMKGSIDTKLTDLEIYNPYHIDPIGWKKLTKALKEDGYTVLEAPWDWRRKINDETVQWYLKSVIDDAKELTARGKVHIVAHSAGGLLTRHYIQGSLYGNDIDKFVMLGTPNGGASGNPYYIWDGGDMERIEDHWLITTTRAFLIDILTRNRPQAKQPDWSALFNNFPQNEVQDIVRKHIPGLIDLMLTADEMLLYPEDNGGYRQEYYPGREFLLTWQLDNDPDKDRLVPGDTISPADDQVRTRLFISQSENTTKEIVVKEVNSNFSPTIYPHGVPTGKVFERYGDGTVLYISSNFGLASKADIHNPLKDSSHAKLPKTYTVEVVDFLNEGKAVPLKTSESADSVTEEVIPPVLTIQIENSIQPMLVSQDGLRLGIDNSTGNLVLEMVGDVSVKSGFSSLYLEIPEDGSYDLNFISPPGMLINVSLSYYDGSESFDVSKYLVGSGDFTGITITLNTADPEPLKIVDSVMPVSNITASSFGGVTHLDWDDVTDPQLAGYRIYRKIEGYQFYDIYGQPAASEFQTSDPWYTGETVDLYSYIVVALNDSGEESFVSEIAVNNDALIARFGADSVSGIVPLTVAFTDQSEGSPTVWEWDFDGDGIVDSTAQNPTWTYTEPGDNTVILKVTADGEYDIRVATGYIKAADNILSDGADVSDVFYMAGVWLTSDLAADLAPQEPDGVVNLLDFAEIAGSWLIEVLPPQEFSDGFETGGFSANPWQHSGNAQWGIVSDIKYEGSYAARSGDISDSQSSTIEITLDTEFENISFYRKVSSESGYDYLRFYIDGVEQDKWSGTSDWAQQTYSITPGEP
jgi:PKD repeat protein/pimeloyl-ACP methyl ester carboxylesterase